MFVERNDFWKEKLEFGNLFEDHNEGMNAFIQSSNEAKQLSSKAANIEAALQILPGI